MSDPIIKTLIRGNIIVFEFFIINLIPIWIIYNSVTEIWFMKVIEAHV